MNRFDGGTWPACRTRRSGPSRCARCSTTPVPTTGKIWSSIRSTTAFAGAQDRCPGSGRAASRMGRKCFRPGLRWTNADGDQPGGGGPVSPGSRMSTRARPPLTVTSGAPSALRPIVTRGLLPGGAGGSAASVVTVPASSMMRMRDGAARDLDAAGRAEAGQRDHGRFAFLCKTVRNGDRGVAPGVGIHALGQGLDKCLTGLVDGLPVGIVRRLARWPFPAPRRGYRLRCQWRSKKGPPRRCKKGPLGGCGLVP